MTFTPKELRKDFIATLYDTLEGVVSPTPYLEISEKTEEKKPAKDGERTETKKVDVKFLNGKGRLPMPGATEVTILDLDVASLFFDDFHLLYEGVTGVGKTYTSDAIFDTVFGKQGHYTLRLSGGILGSSALEPFTVTTLENGVPKTRLDPLKCQQYGALFIDEINRGDTNEVFQVVDGLLHVNGETQRLGLPIPNTKRHKGLAIIAAMNPADAQQSGATALDIAGENRFLKFSFPNGVDEAASSQLENKMSCDLHDKFWTSFTKKTGKKGDWKELYPVVTDSDQFAQSLNGETREFLDVILGYVDHLPKETYEHNADLIKSCGYGLKFSIRTDNDYRKIVETQGMLKQELVRRDLRKIRDLSSLLAFIKGVKTGSYDVNVGLNDVAASIGILLESKSITGKQTSGLMALVNDARSTYTDLHAQLKAPSEYGCRQSIWQAAVQAGAEKGFDAYLKTLLHGMNQLNQQTTTAAQATLRSRILADMVVLEHFSKAHESDVKAVFKEKNIEEVFHAFEEIYSQNKTKAAIYGHRLDFLLR